MFMGGKAVWFAGRADAFSMGRKWEPQPNG